MVEFFYHKETLYLPESYNELTGEQLIKINALLLTEIPKPMLRLKLLQVLLKLNMYRFFKLDADCKHRILFYDRMEDEFLVNDEEEESSIDWIFKKNTLTEQLLPVYRDMYGPRKEFDNLRVNEFHFAEICYFDYITHENIEDLDKLIAVLYRPCKKNYDFVKDSDADARIAFNANELAFYATKIAAWPMEVKTSILCFYDGNREYIRELYQDVFSSSEESKAEGSAGMYDIIRQLAGTKYGNFKEVEQLYLHDVLREIESSMEDNRRQEALFNQQHPS